MALALKCLIPVALLGMAAFLWLRHSKRGSKPDDKPPQSIVLLLARPKVANIQLLAHWLSEDTGRKVRGIDSAADKDKGSDDERAGDFVIGRQPHMLAHVAGATFVIHSLSEPYMKDPLSASESIPELRIRKAVRDHKAWISMDILDSKTPTTQEYRVIAKLLAHLVDSDCLALYFPPTGAFAPWSDDTVEQLQSDDPIQAVFEHVSLMPVIPIDDDPRLRAAEAEARRRFSEFRAAFEATDGTNFAVKTKITRGERSEHIWVEVDRITGNKVEGRLGNEPVDLSELKIGSPVEIDDARVEDWVYFRNDTPAGMFTVPVIQAITRERAAKK
jgi:uncharacterized protein YegJ (DUF2314 family)